MQKKIEDIWRDSCLLEANHWSTLRSLRTSIWAITCGTHERLMDYWLITVPSWVFLRYRNSSSESFYHYWYRHLPALGSAYVKLMDNTIPLRTHQWWTIMRITLVKPKIFCPNLWWWSLQLARSLHITDYWLDCYWLLGGSWMLQPTSNYLLVAWAFRILPSYLVFHWVSYRSVLINS